MIKCPYCERRFVTSRDIRNHVRAQRRTSAAHGLDADRFPRSRALIAEAIAAAIEAEEKRT